MRERLKLQGCLPAGSLVNLKCQHLAQFATLPPHRKFSNVGSTGWMVCQFMHLPERQNEETNSCVVVFQIQLYPQHDTANIKSIDAGVGLALLERCATVLSSFFKNIYKCFPLLQLCWFEVLFAQPFLAVLGAAFYQLQDGEICLVDMGHSVTSLLAWPCTMAKRSCWQL